MVDDDERNTETGAKRHDLLTNGITIGGRTIGVLVHDFGYGSIRDDRSSLFDKVVIQVADERRVDI